MVIALAVVGVLSLVGLIGRLDRGWFDLAQRGLASSAPMPADTALVLIDEQSLEVMGREPFAMRWPWPRSAFAALFAGLEAAGARGMAVDLIFFEDSADAMQDVLLGSTAAGLDGVTLGAVRDPLKTPVVWPEAFRQEHADLFAGRSRWGFVDSEPENDGVIRSYWPAGSLAAAAFLKETNAPDSTRLLRWRGNLEQLRERGLPVVPAAPFVVAGWDILNRATEAAPDLDPRALAAAIRAEPAPEGEVFDLVRGHRVFVGANAAGTFDAVATPVGAPEPGVLVHWTALAGLEAGDVIVPVAPFVGWLLAGVVCIVIVFSARNSRGLAVPGAWAAGGLLVAAGGSVAMLLAGWWIGPGAIATAAVSGFVATVVERFRIERERKREIQGWFGAYVSPEVVKRLVADPEAIALGGERREVSILFLDIAGFTTIGERLAPEDLVTLVNRFLENQSAPILDHGGYLDKYIGDAIMAVFGVPEARADHAMQACRAALDCRDKLEQLNDEIEAEHGMRLGMRIGINTGAAVAGNVGSSRKRNYTVLGDAVNLASRLEGANKATGTSILVGPETAAAVGGELLLRPVARLRVKGKTEAVEVFELIGTRAGAEAATVEFAEAFTRAFRAFCDRRFGAAAEEFERVAVLRPDDVPSKQYFQEARRLAAAPPPPDWQPTLNLETK